MTGVPAQLTTDELALRLGQQQLVAEFGLLALNSGPLQRLLDEAARVVAQGMNIPMAKVLQSRPVLGDLLIVAGVGWHAGVVGHAAIGGGMDSPAGFALHTGQPTVANHLATEQRFRMPALLAEHGVQSAINVVIGQPNHSPFGVLEVDSTRRHEFVEADTAFLQSMANVLSAGIARLEGEQAKDVLLHDKELLMREVHHRVTNSLQLVRTMLGLQGRNASVETRSHLEAAASRIMSIASLHRRLYEGGSVFEADGAVYLHALISDMESLAGEGRSITLHSDPIVLSADTLTSLGLIASELVTNAIKHGAGKIEVMLRRGAAGGLELVVEDAGSGFDGEQGTGATGLGMRLIKSLSKGGTVEIDRAAPGGRVVVTLNS